MASPVADSYTVGSGEKIYAGRAVGASDLLDTIEALAENKWLKLNTNTFQSVWPEVDLRAPFGGGKGSPDTIIEAWSSFAWDLNNHRLVLWGGGHANSAGNEVYLFDATTGLWSLAYHASDVLDANDGYHRPVCGGFRAPLSSHTYDGQLYLPVCDRFLTNLGAAHSSGNMALLYDESGSPLRAVGSYTLNLSQAGLGYVGGGTGDNPHDGAYSATDLTGANAWTLRDWHNTTQADVFASSSSLNIVSAYRKENGKDVVYFTKHGSRSLFRLVISDADDYTTDVITKVGRYWNGSGGDGAGAIDSSRNIFLFTEYNNRTTFPFVMWDLKTAAADNNDQHIDAVDIGGSGKTDFMANSDLGDFGIDFSPTLNCFVLWSTGGDLYKLIPPEGSPTPTTGWLIEKITTTGDRPMTRAELVTDGSEDKGVMGKWKYAPDLNCFIGLQQRYDGNVWLYKPQNWTRPRI